MSVENKIELLIMEAIQPQRFDSKEREKEYRENRKLAYEKFEEERQRKNRIVKQPKENPVRK